MKMIKKLAIFTLSLSSYFFFTGLAFAEIAEECSDNQIIRAQELMKISSLKIVKANIGGVGVQSIMSSCEYNPEDQKLLVSMTVGWNGAIRRKNYYEVTGELFTPVTGIGAEFRMISANEKAEKLAFWKNLGTLALDISSDK